MKKTILTAYYFLCYLFMRLMYLPVFWQGVPAFKYWIENTTKTANQIRFFTWISLMAIIWYFTNIWICITVTLIATCIVLLQLFRLSKKSASLLIIMLFLASCGKKQDRWMHIKFTENIESCIVDSRVVTGDTSILVGDFQKIKYTIYDNGQGGYVDFMRGDTTDFGEEMFMSVHKVYVDPGVMSVSGKFRFIE